ncbi:hypothetical protein INT47_005861 [Mucor saturninus]|uniref:Ndc10 domain-containing protein n=1 Tax=Mucor saturninus TaxID=64648 RepID=A0A8H7QI13_9FUNG|nr:hypothetical protein INT47_005861 [Mucor saturninus]
MKEFKVSRENCEDHGEGTLADGYTSLDQCPALVMILRQGKTNKNNRLELTGCIRSTQVEICPFMILACIYSGDFIIKLFKSSDYDTTKVWAYASHRDAVTRGLEGGQIFSKRKTHINRGSAARMTDLAGVNEDQIRRLGRWNNTTLNRTYLTGLPREVMRVMAGFTVQQGSLKTFLSFSIKLTISKSGQFYLPRAGVDPPESLCKMIFPDLDVWHDRLTAKQANPNNNDEMEVTVAAKAFFELLFMLSKTIIQNAVFMIEKFSTHPLWQNGLFSHELFTNYRERMFIVAQEDNDPVNALLQRCVPILEDKIKCMHHDLSTRLDTQSASQETIIDYIIRLVTGQASISLNISLPGGSGEDQGRTNITTTGIPQQSEPNSLSGNNSMDHSQTFHGNINSSVVSCYRMS